MKEFLTANTIRNNVLKMAHKIVKDDFIPDVIYVSLRGGANIANVLSEYFKLLKKERQELQEKGHIYFD